MSPRIGDEPRLPRLPQPAPAASDRCTTATPPVPPPPAAAPAPPTVGQPQDQFEAAATGVNRVTNGVRSVTDAVLGTQTRNVPGQQAFGPWSLGGQPRSTVEPMSTRASRTAGALGTAASVAQLPGAAYTAVRDARAFAQNATVENGITAAGSGASALSTAANAAKGAIETRNAVANFRGVRDAAAQAMAQNAPDAARSVVNRVAGETAQQVLDGASRQVTRNVAARAAGEGLEAAARAGASAARAAAPHVLAETAGRAASRFVPGLNVAIAAADTAAFGAEVASAVRSGNPNVGKLATGGITALGSIAAATNIPIVSQVGAGVSTVSSFIGSFF
ncbi:hypothetical protein [Stigmatella erecta]|uniref:Uncharacterized protein n=1 Tax=Stigmatella erecta TaxID=83460 RepID=A0A1I0LB54_9BACT|nr:hypothetical protein [Stigmatella erecta]SEU37033.1 hypothetical protein SAMN05443639_12343 [Stigmatella erecta]